MLMVLGMPRSGTTWLARIFDTHPDVLYRHEPDQTVPAGQLPNFPEGDDYERYRPATRDYLDRLTGTSNLHVSGHKPLYAKRFLTPTQSLCRQTVVNGWHLLQTLLLKPRWTDSLPVPDFGAAENSATRIVIKTVISNGRAKMFSDANPNLRIVLIVRHPCGYLASQKRGQRTGKLGSAEAPIGTLSRTREARKYGLTEAYFKELSPDAQKIWYWVIVNDRIMSEMRGSDRFFLLRYEDLCEQPVAKAQELVTFAGLDWSANTEEWLNQIVQYQGDNPDYFSIKRNPALAAQKWRSELTEDRIAMVEDIARGTPPGDLFF
jgi:hypothetical protein